MSRGFLAPTLLSAALFAALHAAAAAPPSAGAIQSGLRDADAYYQRLDRTMRPPGKVGAPLAAEPEAPIRDGFAPQTAAAPTGTGGFWVSAVSVPESQVLRRDQLAALVEPFEQRMVQLDELRVLVDRINALYRARNLVTARAFLPPQEVVDGVVRIELIEARIDQVEVVDNRFTRDGYITRRLDLAEGAFADPNALEAELATFNAQNDVQIRALLKPGTRPNTTRYVLHTLEPRNQVLSAFIDNAGRETIGEERIGLTYTNNSLTGRRDRLSAGASFADGADAGFVVYSVPLTRHGTRAIIGFDYSQIVIVSGELATFDVSGRSTIASAFISRPLKVTRRWSLSGLTGIAFKDSSTDFAGVDRFESAARVFATGAEFQWFGNGYLLYARPQLNFGVKRFGGDSRFSTLNGEAGAVVNAGLSHQLAFRFRGQLSDSSTLPSAEQFQLGGTSSVRGFPEGLLIGDEGYFVSAEYRYQGFSGGPNHRLQPFLFADHGGVFAAAGSPVHRRYLTSAGLGLACGLFDKVTANVQVGFPIGGRTEREGDYAVHFQLSYTPF